MKFFSMFGIGTGTLFSEGVSAPGTVTAVRTCWWLKVNTKAVRWSGSDGAEYPSVISFRYTADGVSYVGRRWLGHSVRPPLPGKKITVFYDPARPARCALDTAQFGFKL